jgi:hypothetical protein
MRAEVRTLLTLSGCTPEGWGERGGGIGDKAGGANPIGIW